MIFRVFLAAFLSAIVMFIWGAVWWTALPFKFYMIRKLPQEEALIQTLRDSIPESGVYFFPWYEEKSGADGEKIQEELVRKQAQGPIGQLFIIKEGFDTMNPMIFVMGFLHGLVCALLAGVLLALAAPGLRSYGRRLFFVFLLGLFAAVVAYVADVIWFHHPWGYALFSVAFTVVNWMLAGLVLAALVKVRPTQVSLEAGK